MEKHPRLHRRKRVDIFDLIFSHDQSLGVSAITREDHNSAISVRIVLAALSSWIPAAFMSASNVIFPSARSKVAYAPSEIRCLKASSALLFSQRSVTNCPST